MGSFGAGFLEAVGDKVAQKADEEHQQEMQRKKLLGDSYLRAISQIGNADGSPLTDQQKQQIATYQDEYDKLYGKSKGMKDALLKVRHITGLAMGHPEWGRGAQQSSPNQGATAPAKTPGIPPPPGVAPSAGDPDKQIISGPAAAAASDRADSPLVQPNWTPPPGIGATPAGDQKKNDLAAPAVSDTSTPPAGNLPAAPTVKLADTVTPSTAPDATSTTSSVAEEETPSSDALQKSLTRGGVLPPPPLPPAPAPLPPPNFAPAVPPPPGHPPNIEPWVEAYRLANPSLDEQNARALKQQEAIRAMQAKYKIQELEAQARAQATKPSNARAVEGHPVGQTEAQDMIKLGQEFPDINGNPIDPSLIKPGTELIPVYLGGGKTYWRLGSQTGRVLTADNTVNATGNLDASHGLAGATPIGKRTPDRTSSRQVAAANGQVNTLHSSTSYGGRPGSTAPVPNPPHSASTANSFISGTPVTTPSGHIPKPPSGNQPRATAPEVTRKPSSNSDGPLHLTQAGYNQERQIITPVREAATQMFGDPTSGLKGLAEYGPLYDNADARRRVATAIALTFGGDEHTSEKDGGLYSIMKNYAGVPQDLAASQVAAKTAALAALTPQEQDWYDALISTYGAAVGLRSLTKASGAMSSVKRIEQELPLPDISTRSQASFYNRMANLSEMVYNGTRTLSNQVMPDEEKERYHSYVKKFLNQKSKLRGSSDASSESKKIMTPPPGVSRPIKTASDLLQKYTR